MFCSSNRSPLLRIVWLCLFFGPASAPLLAQQTRAPLPWPPAGEVVDEAAMNAVYEQVKTPFKYGIVLRGENGNAVDCPGVFRHGSRWYMTYIVMNRVGYETRLAASPDLLHWETLGTTLAFQKNGWDAWQAAGYPALQDPKFGGSYRLEKYAGSYWMSYLGGALQGYETDPLAIGMARTAAPDKALPWSRLPSNPVLHRDQEDARAFEKVTLYKSNVIRDPRESLGYPFVMFYNGKSRSGERIGMAVSRDMVSWQRFGDGPVIENGTAAAAGISGDPQVVRIGGLWVMFYFGAFWKPGAFDTFACSRDLVRWTRWTGQDLVAPSESWDRKYAHKPWVVRHQGVVYHFYCAVGDEGRVIALATSRDLRTK